MISTVGRRTDFDDEVFTFEQLLEELGAAARGDIILYRATMCPADGSAPELDMNTQGLFCSSEISRTVSNDGATAIPLDWHPLCAEPTICEIIKPHFA